MYYEKLFGNGLEKRAMDEDTSRVLAQVGGGAGGAAIGSGVPLVGSAVQDFANSMHRVYGVGHRVNNMHKAIYNSMVDNAVASGAVPADLGKWPKSELDILEEIMRNVRSTPSNELADNILKDTEGLGKRFPDILNSAKDYKGAKAKLEAGLKKSKLLKVLAGVLGVAGAGAGVYAGGKLHDAYAGNDLLRKLRGITD